MGTAQAGISVTSGPRPFNPFRDLPAVASLLARAFGPELELESESGARFVHWMNRLPALAWTWIGFEAWFDGNLGGYVWVEDGRVVANATVAPLTSSGRQWVLSNVAVLEEWRGRGIGRSLVRACLRHVAERGGERVLLQVWQSNKAAGHIYESEGFRAIGRTWRLTAMGAIGVLPVATLEAPGWIWRRFHPGDRAALATLAAGLGTVDTQVLRSQAGGAFDLGPGDWLRALLGLPSGGTRMTLRQGERVRGGLALRPAPRGWRRLTLVVAPSVETETGGLVSGAVARELARREHRPVLVDLADSLPTVRQALVEIGFQETDALVQMALDRL